MQLGRELDMGRPSARGRNASILQAFLQALGHIPNPRLLSKHSLNHREDICRSSVAGTREDRSATICFAG